MTTVSIRLLENDRVSVRGASRQLRGVVIDIDADETIPVTIDWTSWLAGDTISSVSNLASGVTVSGASNTTTAASFKLSGSSAGYVEHRVTTTAGAIKELIIWVNGPAWPMDYE